MKKIVLLLSMGLLLFSCGPQENPDHHLPSVSTGTVTNITTTTATCSGNVTSDGGSSVTSRGVCWSTTQNPTTANSKTIDDLAQKTKAVDGTGLGTYNSDITGLSTNTTYYVRAYATNSQGTAYGEQRAFTTNAELTIPSVTTGDVTNITTTTADCSGNVTSDGGSSVTARGVYWSTSENPTTSNSKTTDGTGLGTYNSDITGLSTNTTYYVRAYATNSQGTAYGEQKSFRTYGTFSDSRDGHVYKIVTIGSQVWMVENLAYLPSVVGPATGSKEDPYYYVYGYDGTVVADAKTYVHTPGDYGEYTPEGAPINSYATYGVLYNWPAAMTACPKGWHLPSDAEWTTLIDYLGGTYFGGGKMKEVGTAHWESPNKGATNDSGFTALPGGFRLDSGIFYGIGTTGNWWSSTQYDTNYAWRWQLYDYISGVDCKNSNKEYGFSVRCLQD